MHGGSTIQLRPRNSFDGDKEALATKKKRASNFKSAERVAMCKSDFVRY